MRKSFLFWDKFQIVSTKYYLLLNETIVFLFILILLAVLVITLKNAIYLFLLVFVKLTKKGINKYLPKIKQKYDKVWLRYISKLQAIMRLCFIIHHNINIYDIFSSQAHNSGPQPPAPSRLPFRRQLEGSWRGLREGVHQSGRE